VRDLELSAGAGRPRIGDIGHMRRLLRRWLVDSIPDQVADLGDVIDRWRPDVIICDVAMWAPIVIIAETTSAPVALSTTTMGPPCPGPEVPPPGLGLPSPNGPARRALAWTVGHLTDVVVQGQRRRLDDLRASHGLEPMHCSVNALMGPAAAHDRSEPS
jgi:hypothetical protein